MSADGPSRSTAGASGEEKTVSPGEGLTRRRFLGRVARAGAIFAVAGGAAALLYDGKGPEPGSTDSRVASGAGPGEPGAAGGLSVLPDYRVAAAGQKLAIAAGSDRAKTVAAALAALGGIETFIRPGDRVLLKVNAAFASPPLLGATTHPDLVREVVRLCHAAGAAEIRVTDNPINDPATCFRLTGLAEAAEKSGGKLILPREREFEPFTLPGATLLRDCPLLAGPLRGVNKVIGLAPVKDHHRSGASMSMKNWYGLLGGRRNVFHQDVHTIITELAQMMRPTLVILDGTTAMMSNGPTGGAVSDLKTTNLMIASTDQVAADAFGATLLERSLGDLPYLERAAAAGLGTTDFESLKPARVTVEG